MHFYTSANNQCLAYARILARSVKEHHPEAKFSLILCDELINAISIANEPFDEILTLEQLGFEDKNLNFWIYLHTNVELRAAVKGQALVKFLRDGSDKVVYLAPKMALLGKLDDLDTLLEQNDVILIPADCAPARNQPDTAIQELYALRHGMYILDMYAVRNTPNGIRFAEWWRDRLWRFCYDDIPNGLYLDQKWADFAPILFDGIHHWHAPGCILSTRDTTSLSVEKYGENYSIEGLPLRAYHFTGITADTPTEERESSPEKNAAILSLWEWYNQKRNDEILDESAKNPSAYDFYDNGEPISIEDRIRLRNDKELHANFERINPYITKQKKSYHQWLMLQEQAPLAIERAKQAKEQSLRNRPEKGKEEIFNSKSWKLTKLLRDFKILLKKYVYAKRNHSKNEVRSCAVEDMPMEPAPQEEKQELYAKQPQPIATFAKNPLISIVVPIYNTLPAYLTELIDSVQQQSYENWELCIASGSSQNSEIKTLLEAYMEKDARVRVTFLAENRGISGNTNEALAMIRGEYIALADHDDLLAPNALFEIVKVINEQNADFIYTDEDMVDATSKVFYNRNFKPDFAPDQLRSYNYICHLMAFSVTLWRTVGNLNERFDGSQDHDLALRLTEKARRIVHIPQVLYHWRQFPDSMSKQQLEKCQTAGRGAIAAQLSRLKLRGKVDQDIGYRIRYERKDDAPVSVILLHKDNRHTPAQRVADLCGSTSQARLAFTVVDLCATASSIKEETEFLYIAAEPNQTEAHLLNQAAKMAQGKYLLFMDDRLQPLNAEWLNELLMYAQRREIGCVTSKIFFRDKLTVYSAGYILSEENGVYPAFFGLSNLECYGLDRFTHNLSLVSRTYLAVQKDVFTSVGGFSETFSGIYGDADFCLRLLKSGLRHVYTPYASVCNQGKNYPDDFSADRTQFLQTYQEQYVGHVYMPNISHNEGDPFTPLGIAP